MKAYFYESGGDIVVKARAEGDGIVGDLTEIVTAGRDFAGISYEALIAAKDGVLDIDDETGQARIVGRGAIDEVFAKPRVPVFRVGRLTADQKAAASAFRAGKHAPMNAVLRAEEAPEHGADTHARIAHLRAAVEGGSVTRSGLVYRAVAGGSADMADVDAKFGHVVTWRGFTSVTTDEARARGHLGGRGVLFRILLPQGSHALQYAQVSGEDDPDGEVILPAGAHLAVREASSAAGITMINLVMFKRGPHDGTEEN